MSADDAAKMIEAVLLFNPADQVRARDAGTVARSCEPHCAVSSTTGTVVGSAIVQQQPEAPTAPQQGGGTPTVALGQTTSHVTAILGSPNRSSTWFETDLQVSRYEGRLHERQSKRRGVTRTTHGAALSRHEWGI